MSGDATYSAYAHLIVSIEKGGVLVTLNRPEVYNATNNRMHRELTTIWADLDRDARVRTIVVTGAGDRAFSAGGRPQRYRCPWRVDVG